MPRSSTLWLSLALSLVAAPLVGAQDIPGPPLQPIATLDLMRYADQLELSATQCEAVGRFHDLYKQQYIQVHTNELIPFLRTFVWESPTSDSKDWKRFARHVDRLLYRNRTIEETLFRLIKGELDEGQLGRFAQIERYRRQSRLHSVYFHASGARCPLFDLRDAVNQFELQDSDRQRAEPILVEYDQALDAQVERFARVSRDVIVDFRRAEARLSETESVEAMDAYIAATAPILGQDAELRELYFGAYQQLLAVIPARDARRLRDTLRRVVLRDTLSITRNLRSGGEFERAIRLEGVTVDQVALLEAIATERDRELDTIIAEAIARSLEFQRSTPVLNSYQSAWDRHAQSLRELRTLAQAVDAQASDRMRATLGENLFLQIQLNEPRRRSRGGRRGGSFDPASGSFVARSPSSDPLFPSPIQKAHLRLYRWLFQLTEDQFTLLELLHIDYLDEFEQRILPLAEERAPRDALAAGARIARRKDARARTSELDTAFFGDVEALLDQQQRMSIDRVRHAREREVHALSWFELRSHPIFTSRIDLLWLLYGFGIKLDENINQRLVRYDELLTNIVREMYSLKEVRERHLVQIRAETRDPDAPPRRAILPTYAVTNRRLRDRDILARDVNLRTLHDLAATLPPKAGSDLFRYFNTVAYPSLDRDPAAMGEVLTALIDDPRLAEEHRLKLRQLQEAYQLSYGTFSDNMIAVLESIDLALWSEDHNRGRIAHEVLRRLLWERNDLNQRTIWTVQLILAESSVGAYFNLPDPSAVKRTIWH